MKKIFYLIKYIRILKKNKKILANSRVNNNPNPLGIQYDWIYRLYTVLNLPFDDKENFDKYGYYYLDNMVKEHVSKINDFLFELGILEYVVLDTENIVQIDQYNIRIVLKFKYLNLKKIFKNIFILFIILIVFGIIGLIVFI